jgi:hyperosmotically inducible protein
MSTNNKLTNNRYFKLIKGIASIFFLGVPLLLRADNSVIEGLKNIEDAKITSQAKTRLAIQKNIPVTKIKITTVKGIVYLSGVLNSYSIANDVIESVASIDGVKDVDTSNLKIENEKTIPLEVSLDDSYITAKVKGMLFKKFFVEDKNISGLDIKVETKNGVVYLNGKVQDKKEKNDIMSIVNQVKGVKSVVSYITIK